jgi:hypothetical protein
MIPQIVRKNATKEIRDWPIETEKEDGDATESRQADEILNAQIETEKEDGAQEIEPKPLKTAPITHTSCPDEVFALKSIRTSSTKKSTES